MRATIALLALTVAEAMLYLIAIPFVSVSWRSYHFYSSVHELSDPLDFDRKLLTTISNIILDVPFVPMFLLTVVSWRSCSTITEMKATTSNVELRWTLMRNTGFDCLFLFEMLWFVFIQVFLFRKSIVGFHFDTPALYSHDMLLARILSLVYCASAWLLEFQTCVFACKYSHGIS